MTIEPTLGPRSFDELVGQPKLKHRLSISMDAALADNRPLEHVLLQGPPGSGKSTIANLIAEHLGDPIVTVVSPLDPRDLERKLEELGAGILFLDEIHGWTRRQTIPLLPLLEARQLDTGYGIVEYRYLTIIAATTEPEKLTDAFKDRFIVPPVEEYTVDEMADIVAGFAERAQIFLDEATCKALGVAASGVPRVARSFVIAARNLMTCDEPATADDILKFCDVEPDGFSRDHLAYLEALAANHGRGGIEMLSTRLRMHRTTILNLERLLLERKLIVLEPGGRQLTGRARQRLDGNVSRPGRFAVGAA